MNKDEKFEELYKKLESENLTELELQKQKAIRERKKNNDIGKRIFIFLLIISLAFILVFIKIDYENLGGIISTIILGALGLTLYIHFEVTNQSEINDYEESFKSKIINKIINFFNSNLIYKYKEGISKQIYDEADFEEYNIYHSEDLITGEINNCKINMAEVTALYQKKNVNGEIYTESSFDGIFAKIETPKPFNTDLYIRKDSSILRKFQFDKLSYEKIKIELDSTEFEEIFDIYASNEIQAMQILTADVMEILVEFYNKLAIPFEITIKNNYIYIRFHCGDILEVVPIDKSCLDKDIIYKNYEILDFILKVINKLVNIIDETPYM